MTGGTYIVGDIHGCYNEWMEMKSRIESEDSEATFILVGDIIDRGPYTMEMIDWAMSNITETGKYQMIMGNHEQDKLSLWITYLKKLTKGHLDEEADDDIIPYDSYDFVKLYKNKGKKWKDIAKYVSWVSKLDYFKDITINNRRFIISHANLPYSIIDEDNGYTLRRPKTPREKYDVAFNRECDDFDKIPDTTLIHGHNASVFEESFHYSIEVKDEDLGKIIYMNNRINIDCGLVYRRYGRPGNLAVIRLNDMKEYYLY